MHTPPAPPGDLYQSILSEDLEFAYLVISRTAGRWAMAGLMDEANHLLERLWSFHLPHAAQLWMLDEGLQIMWMISGRQPDNIPFAFKDVDAIERENRSRFFWRCGDQHFKETVVPKPFSEVSVEHIYPKAMNAGADGSEKPEAIAEALKTYLDHAKDYSWTDAATCGALISARNDLDGAATYFITRIGQGYLGNYWPECVMRDRKCARYLLTGLLAPVWGLTREDCNAETEILLSSLSKRIADGRVLRYKALDWGQLLQRISDLALAQNEFDFSEDTLARKSLSEPPATKEAIKEVEQKLGVSFPEDYKDFLLTSNGFAQFSSTGVTLSRKSLIIGGLHEEQQLLLVPSGDGRLECWHFAVWRPGEDRYPDFRTFMEGELYDLEKESTADHP